PPVVLRLRGGRTCRPRAASHCHGRNLLSEVMLEELVESHGVRGFDLALAPQRLLRFACKFCKALLVRRIELQEVRLVQMRHAQGELRKGLSTIAQLLESTRRRSERCVEHFGLLQLQRGTVWSRRLPLIEQLADA